MTKKFITICVDSELLTLIQNLKEVKKTTNSSQIIREALWSLAEKILPQNVHICNKAE